MSHECAAIASLPLTIVNKAELPFFSFSEYIGRFNSYYGSYSLQSYVCYHNAKPSYYTAIHLAFKKNLQCYYTCTCA